MGRRTNCQCALRGCCPRYYLRCLGLSLARPGGRQPPRRNSSREGNDLRRRAEEQCFYAICTVWGRRNRRWPGRARRERKAAPGVQLGRLGKGR